MASLARLLERNLRNSRATTTTTTTAAVAGGAHFLSGKLYSQQAKDQEYVEEEEFRVLNLRSTTERNFTKRRVFKRDDVMPPRSLRMATDQDWSAVWPGPRTYHPAAVPLPMRQGYTEKGAAAPSKFANAELMKIPNFLHLTPPAIRQQCEALKKFCTPWPKALNTDEKCERHFPLEVITTDYCHGLPTIRNPEARRVTIAFKLSQLKFDTHARDKFLRLIGDRYNSDTDTVTIVADRCPLRKQNYDYALYLLTACYHESFVTEPWEATKSEADMEYYAFERNKSKQSIEGILNWGRPSGGEQQQAAPEFGHCVEELINDGENEYNLSKYKNEVIKVLGISAK